MKKFVGFEHGMGIGGWLTNYKRFNCIPENQRMDLTIGDFEHFNTYITEDDIAYIKSLGMDHIRLGFDQIVVENPDGSFRKEIIDKIKDFCDWCQKYNLNAVLNLHKAKGNYCDIEENETLLESERLKNGFVRFWEKMEEEFSSYKSVAFEILNEVKDVEPKLWNDLAKRTIDAIRAKNTERIIIIGSTRWNSPDTLKDLEVYDDENVIYTFHTYNPFSFTHQRGVLVSGPLYYNRKMPYPCDIEPYRDYEKTVNGITESYMGFERMDKEYIYSSLKGAADFIKMHPDKILWCGEFGTIRHAKIEWRENWMRDVISFLIENEIPYSVWNYLSTPNDGNRFSLVDDDNRKILSENMAKIIKGEI